MRILRPIRMLSTAAVLACAVAGGLVGLALAGGGEEVSPAPSGNPPAQRGAPTSIQRCGECHADIVADWSAGPHALAFSDPIFQSAWESQIFSGICLECHTTGYSPATGLYKEEGVTCEACHGAVPSLHPTEPASIDEANTTCFRCHTVTHAEFRASLHEQSGLKCTSCHYSHTNGLRLRTEIDQCLNCHGYQLNDFAHASHIEIGLTCRQCHGYVRPGSYVSRADGQAPTGHDFRENVSACLDCHDDIRLSPVNGEISEESFSSEETSAAILAGQQAALRVTELEAEVQTLEAERRNQVTMNIIQGSAGGLLVGGIAVWLLARRKGINGNNQTNGKKVDEAEDGR